MSWRYDLVEGRLASNSFARRRSQAPLHNAHSARPSSQRSDPEIKKVSEKNPEMDRSLRGARRAPRRRATEESAGAELAGLLVARRALEAFALVEAQRRVFGADLQVQRAHAERAKLGVELGERGGAGAGATRGLVDPLLGEPGIAAGELEVVADRDDRVADDGGGAIARGGGRSRAVGLDQPDAAVAGLGEQAAERGFERVGRDVDAFVGVERTRARQDRGQVGGGRAAQAEHRRLRYAGGMGEKKTPRSTIVIGAAAVGGVIAVNVAQKYKWALESSGNTAIVAIAAAG